ncbi:MAG: exosortase H [Thiothrix nivea]|nr:MAG: exosortase H [Thiothrix nivea]
MNKRTFIVVLLVLFTLELLGPVQDYVVQPFTQGLAALSAMLVQTFDSQVTAHGIIIQSLKNDAAVAIQPGCNGIEAMICLTAAVLAYPSTWYERFFGLVVGYLAIQVLNIVRIISLFYLLQWNAQWFEWAHLYAWQALIFLDVLIVFVLWIRWLPSRGKASPEDGEPPVVAHA